MRKFLINVNGNQYEVEVEEITSGVPSQPQISNPQPQVQTTPKIEKPSPEPAKEPKVEAPKKVVAATGQEVVKAPMPGTILKINVNEGETVKKGQVLLILEAMKMENEILAPRDGKVVNIAISQGASVNTGDDMVVLE